MRAPPDIVPAVSQILRVAALGTTVLAWLALTLLVLPAIEAHGDSPLVQLAVAAAFILWLVWAAAGIAYDRSRRAGLARRG